MKITLVSEAGAVLELPDRGASPLGWVLAPFDDGAMEGWWTSPAPRAEAVARPQANGAFAPSRLLVGARVLTVVFHHWSRQDPVAEREARELVAAMSRGWLRVVVEDAGEVRHVRGFVSAEPKIQHRSPTVSTHSLVITCPDPVKYAGPGSDDEALSGWESVMGRWGTAALGGALFPLFDQAPRDDVSATTAPTLRFTETGLLNSLTCVNAGTEPTWPVLEVDGPVKWAQWQLGDHVVRWQGTVPSGLTLRINTHIGHVTIGGQTVGTALLIQDDYFQLSPGENVVSFSASDSTVWRVRWMSAWM